MTTFGIDYAEPTPSTNALTQAGVKFVCRYLSGYESKDLGIGEAKALSRAGINIVVVWERGADDATRGYAAGVDDAKAAARLAAERGMPSDRPIFFAVDDDLDGSQVANYFEGVKSVLGWRTGVYAGVRVCRYLFQHGLIGWAWQTYAWSGGAWSALAHLEQYSNDHTLAHVSCDYDRALFADYGQWRIGWSPAKPNLYPLLGHGSRGRDVARLSRNLHFLRDPQNGDAPYYAPHWPHAAFPGLPFFTRGLTTALRAFQARHHLPLTGRTDRHTWQAIGLAIAVQKKR